MMPSLASDLTLTVALIARDEERYIAAALASAAPVADELLVLLDTRTTDATAMIARAYAARVIMAEFVSFPAQRNLALELAHGRWVLFLDADERLTPELQHELLALKASLLAQATAPTTGCWIPRFNLYWGRRLRGGGWYPDHQLRLLRRGQVHYNSERLVHELVETTGATEYLHTHLLHINIESWGELRHKQHAYALAEAATLHRAGVRCRPRNLVLQPLREVWRRWWTWRGYRDGWLGVLLASVMGWYELVKYVHLWRLQREQGRNGEHQ